MTQTLTLRLGDCVDVLRGMKEGDVGAFICDPPYGLEFMGKEWDDFSKPQWAAEGSFSSPGIGDRERDWPSFNRQAANLTCAECGGRMRGKKQCSCDKPHDHWKPVGYGARTDGFRRQDNPADVGRDSVHGRTSATSPEYVAGFSMQKNHEVWLAEAFRVLPPGGVIKAFSGTRTFHRLAAAMDAVGFVDLEIEAWVYGSGFPKSLDISKALDKQAGAEREVTGQKGGRYESGFASATTASAFGNVDPRANAVENMTRAGQITAPATDAAKRFQGWGTALKPSWEPVLVGRKPA